MSANPFRLPDEPQDNPFDTIVIGGEYMPGLCSIWAGSKPSRKFKWDKKVGAGTAGDTLTYRGSLLVELVIDLTFWEAEQVDEWDAKAAALEAAIGANARDVTHPVLDRLKVRSIVVAEIVQLFPRGIGGCAWGVQIGVNEYRPAPKANVTGTPDGSGKGGTGSKNDGTKKGGNQPPTAKSVQEQEIAKLLAEAKKPV